MTGKNNRPGPYGPAASAGVLAAVVMLVTLAGPGCTSVQRSGTGSGGLMSARRPAELYIIQPDPADGPGPPCGVKYSSLSPHRVRFD